MVSASWLLRKSSKRSACEPRAPRWTSEINKVRKRRSGLSSLESLPIPAHLTDFCDSAMTVHATDSPTRINAAPLLSRIAARCDRQATCDDMRSPDAAKRNPGPACPLIQLSRIGLRSIRATPRRLIKLLKMMDRAVAVPDAETVRRRNRRADPGLGVAHGRLHALTLRQFRGNRRGERAAGAVGIFGGDARRGECGDTGRIDQIVNALGALAVAA